MSENKNNLSEMMNDATSGSDSNKGIVKGKDKASSSRKTIQIVAVLGSVALLAVALLVIFRPRMEAPDIDNGPVIREEIDVPTPPEYKDVGAPIELLTWTKMPYSEFLEDEKAQAQAIEWASSQIGFYSSQWMAAADGWANDPAEAMVDEFIPNNNYAYVLREDVEFAFATKVHRLINPVFGEWSDLQDQNGAAKTTLQRNGIGSMFTGSWWSDYTRPNDFSKVPVFADWDSNGYGGLSFNNDEAPYFFGEIVGMNLRTDILEDNSNMVLIADIDVRYVANTKNGKVEKLGVLHLRFEPNLENIGDPIDRMLITEAWLTMEGEEEVPEPFESNVVGAPTAPQNVGELEEDEVVTEEDIYIG